MSQLNDVIAFYRFLEVLEHRSGGRRKLRDCDGRQSWPCRGVYFFFESGEQRSTPIDTYIWVDGI